MTLYVKPLGYGKFVKASGFLKKHDLAPTCLFSLLSFSAMSELFDLLQER